jgi:hypothetical protein
VRVCVGGMTLVRQVYKVLSNEPLKSYRVCVSDEQEANGITFRGGGSMLLEEVGPWWHGWGRHYLPSFLAGQITNIKYHISCRGPGS